MFKKICAISLSLLLAASIAGCSGESETQEEASSENRLTKVTVAVNPFIGIAPVYIANDAGIFAKYGLDVDIVSFDDPSQALSALISGNADIAGTTLDSTVIIADQYRDDMPQIVSVSDESAGADGIIAKNSINSVADLKGKTVGVAINQTTHFLLQQALEQAGISEDDLNLVDMTSSDAGAAFISGGLDAAVTWEPYLSNAVNAGVGKLIFSSADAPGSIMDVIVVSKETAAEKPAWVDAYLSALDEAEAYVLDESTTDNAMEITAKYLEVSKDEAAAMLPTVKLYSRAEAAEALADGGITGQTAGKISDFYTEKGIISAAVNADDIIDGSIAASQSE